MASCKFVGTILHGTLGFKCNCSCKKVQAQASNWMLVCGLAQLNAVMVLLVFPSSWPVFPSLLYLCQIKLRIFQQLSEYFKYKPFCFFGMFFQPNNCCLIRSLVFSSAGLYEFVLLLKLFKCMLALLVSHALYMVCCRNLVQT